MGCYSAVNHGFNYHMFFKAILKGVGCNPEKGKKKGGVKAHTINDSQDYVPYFVSYTASAQRDHLLMKDVDLPIVSFICKAIGYVVYE